MSWECHGVGVAGTAGKGSVSLCVLVLLHPGERLSPSCTKCLCRRGEPGPGAWSSPGHPVAALLRETPGITAPRGEGTARTAGPAQHHGLFPAQGWDRQCWQCCQERGVISQKKASGCVFPIQDGVCSRVRVLLNAGQLCVHEATKVEAA